MLAEVQELGADLVAISPEIPEVAQVTAQKNGVIFRVLSDRGNHVARKFGLVFKLPPDLCEFYKSLGINLATQNGDESWELPLAATYLVDRDGVIRAGFVDPDYVKRMEPADIVAALRRLPGGSATHRPAR